MPGLEPLPRFGLNRFDSRSVDAFAADVRRAEQLGWDAALQPDSQLRRRDTYVLLAAAARVTERIALGPLLANPVNRHPTVTASSIATVDELAPGRVLLGWGVGDTAVRLAGLKPARVNELEASTRLMRALLDGQAVEVGAARPAPLPPATRRRCGSAPSSIPCWWTTRSARWSWRARWRRAITSIPRRSSTRPGWPGPAPIRRGSSTRARSGRIFTTRRISRRAGARWTSSPRARPTPSAFAGRPPRWRDSWWTLSAARPRPSTTWCSTRSLTRSGPAIPSATTPPASPAKSC